VIAFICDFFKIKFLTYKFTFLPKICDISEDITRRNGHPVGSSSFVALNCWTRGLFVTSDGFL